MVDLRLPSQKVVEVDNLCKSYDDLEVFNGLDLRIEKGDRIAVVGVNGAGNRPWFEFLPESNHSKMATATSG